MNVSNRPPSWANWKPLQCRLFTALLPPYLKVTWSLAVFSRPFQGDHQKRTMRGLRRLDSGYD